MITLSSCWVHQTAKTGGKKVVMKTDTKRQKSEKETKNFMTERMTEGGI